MRVHFDGAAGDVDDPVLVDGRRGVERSLDLAVVLQRRVGDLDREERAIGMAIGVEPGRDDRHVGLWRRSVGGIERALDAHPRSSREAQNQELAESIDHAHVGRADGRHAEHDTVNELDSLTAEEAKLPHAVVLGARQLSRTRRGFDSCSHGARRVPRDPPPVTDHHATAQ